MDDIERYARLMGMKRSEVLEVVPGDGGARVRTSDGAWTHVSDGTFTLVDAPEVTLERDSGTVEPEPEKPAPKRRGRS